MLFYTPFPVSRLSAINSPSHAEWHGFLPQYLKSNFMVVPFIALLVLLILVVFFIAKAGKKERKGEDLGEPGKHMSHS
jgi:hypothetical protein